ncbi:MAG: hypothetical protein EOO42_04030 [Flavobacteriales bacterium]|nr:MAG: hypothetical protein EOO42_04030 [Flavobacteriales bacterium]
MEDLKKFNASLIKILTRLGPEFSDCKAISFMTKVEVRNGRIADVSFSDSADSTLVAILTGQFKNTDTISLLNYSNKLNRNQVVFMMPISYNVITRDCSNPAIDYKTLSLRNRFKGKVFSGDCVLLEPNGLNILVQDDFHTPRQRKKKGTRNY